MNWREVRKERFKNSPKSRDEFIEAVKEINEDLLQSMEVLHRQYVREPVPAPADPDTPQKGHPHGVVIVLRRNGQVYVGASHVASRRCFNKHIGLFYALNRDLVPVELGEHNDLQGIPAPCRELADEIVATFSEKTES